MVLIPSGQLHCSLMCTMRGSQRAAHIYIITINVRSNDIKALEKNVCDILKEGSCNVQRGLV